MVDDGRSVVNGWCIGFELGFEVGFDDRGNQFAGAPWREGCPLGPVDVMVGGHHCHCLRLEHSGMVVGEFSGVFGGIGLPV